MCIKIIYKFESPSILSGAELIKFKVSQNPIHLLQFLGVFTSQPIIMVSKQSAISDCKAKVFYNILVCWDQLSFPTYSIFPTKIVQEVNRAMVFLLSTKFWLGFQGGQKTALCNININEGFCE